MLRPVLFLHRWLGVIVGLLMTMWCLSGFVMMYVDYPRLAPTAQLEGLAPLQPIDRVNLSQIDMPPDTALASARVEMMAGRAVLRAMMAVDPSRPIAQMRALPDAFDLQSGEALAPLGQRDLRRVADVFGKGRHVDGAVASVTETPIDQWTVQTYTRNAPLYRVDYTDDGGTQAYIAGKSGEVVQQTTRFQRFWGWLGAVPHWLYPTVLRQNGELWSQVVIWTSFIGCFLTVTGLWVGIARVRRKRDGSIGSPYRGVWWWHHVFGLFFGLLTLTWVASGLFSMNPWGLLDSMAGFSERQQLRGEIHWAAVRAALASQHNLPNGTVRLEATPLSGKLFLTAIDRNGSSSRFSATGEPAPLQVHELRTALTRVGPLASLERLNQEDAYYYSHKSPAPLPVWRARFDDPEHSILYLDAVTGQLVRAFDGNGRKFRWLQDGLHSLDFPILRTRPLWDIVVVPLLAMVTVICATGTYMAWFKVQRDIRRLRRRLRRPVAASIGEP